MNIVFCALLIILTTFNVVCQEKDSCDVFIVSHKRNNKKYYYYKGDHSMIKLKNGKIFRTAEWLNFSDGRLHITKGYNNIYSSYVGDTIVNIEDIKWIFWDGIPRKRLRNNTYSYKIVKMYTNCEYRGWNHLYFKNEMEF
jgi:hypothetical protein